MQQGKKKEKRGIRSGKERKGGEEKIDTNHNHFFPLRRKEGGVHGTVFRNPGRGE